MKKILLFLCALVCSVAMSAKTIYLNASMWDKDGASFKENVSGKAMTAVADMGAYYQVELDETQTKVHFQRIGNNSVWNEVAAQDIPADKNLFTITDWGAGTWSTYDPSVVITYIDITIRVKAATAPTIWWWNAGSKCPNAENVEKEPGVKYTWEDQPVMTAVEGKTGWFEWILKDVNSETGVTFKLNSGEKEINAKESTCYNTSGGIIDCNSDEPIGPIDPTEKVYVVTGGDVNIFGTEWDVNSACVLEKQTDGSYAWTKTDVTLAAGSVAYKMLEKGTWDGWQLPAKGSKPDNASFTIDKSGTYDLTFTLSADLSTQNVVTKLKEEVEVLPVVRLMGSLTNWADGLVLTPSDDKLTASGVVSLVAMDYKMKIKVDGSWFGNNGTMTREYCKDWIFSTLEGSDATITADVAGDYTFTWTYANKSLSVTYPMDGPTSISSTEAEVVTTKVIRDGQVLIIRDGVVYNMMGQAIR